MHLLSGTLSRTEDSSTNCPSCWRALLKQYDDINICTRCKLNRGAVYLLEDVHPHSQCVGVKLVQPIEVAEDDSILW